MNSFEQVGADTIVNAVSSISHRIFGGEYNLRECNLTTVRIKN